MYLSLIFATFIAACTSKNDPKANEKKALETITRFMQNSLPDPTGFEIIFNTPLDSAYTRFEDSKDGILMEIKMQELENHIYNAHEREKHVKKNFPISDTKEIMFKVLNPQNRNDTIKAKERTKMLFDPQILQDSINYYNAALTNLKQNYMEKTKNVPPRFDGWKIEIKYRAKNQYGALEFKYKKFIITESLLNVLSSEDVNYVELPGF